MSMNFNKPYTRVIDVIANAIVNSDPEIMCENQLSKELQLHFADARDKGFKPVSVRWPDGRFALLVCEPGTDMPDANAVLQAYVACVNTDKRFPDMEVTWLSK